MASKNINKDTLYLGEAGLNVDMRVELIIRNLIFFTFMKKLYS